MKKLLIPLMAGVLVTTLIVSAKLQVPSVPNVSDELKQIVYTDETSKKKDGKCTLVLGEEAQEGIYVSIITVDSKSVRVDYLLMLSNVNIEGFFADNDGDGKVDDYNETINGVPVVNKIDLVQKCYENYLVFAREVSETGVYIEPKKDTEDA